MMFSATHFSRISLSDHYLVRCSYHKAFVVYAGCNLVLAAAAAALCAYVAPAAAGSGIPEVKAYLNGVDAYSILAPSTLFVKVGPNLILLACFLFFLFYIQL